MITIELRILRTITDGNFFTDRLQQRENLRRCGIEEPCVSEWKDVPIVEWDSRHGGNQP